MRRKRRIFRSGSTLSLTQHTTPGLMEQMNENAAVVNQLNSALECLNCFMNADFCFYFHSFVRCCLKIHTILLQYIMIWQERKQVLNCNRQTLTQTRHMRNDFFIYFQY